MSEDRRQVENTGEIESVFVGTFTHSLDPKKRVTVPSEWREQIKGPGSIFVVPGVDDACLCAFTAREMTQRLSNIGHHSIADQKARQFSRILASRSDLTTWDSQGRIRVKDDLLNFAGIKGQVILVGNFRFFEMWDPERLKESGVMDQGDLGAAVRHVGF